MRKKTISDVRLKCQEPYAVMLLQYEHVFHLLKKGIKTVILSITTTAMDLYLLVLVFLQEQPFEHEELKTSLSAMSSSSMVCQLRCVVRFQSVLDQSVSLLIHPHYSIKVI